ncbi:MAG: photosystem stability/assembly factor-like protein [Ignavibacteria bacterium]|nr:photosystem stability/assembly factor-like protein [Ignavibacteria bacterium]
MKKLLIPILFLTLAMQVPCQTGKYRSGIFLHLSVGTAIWGPNGSPTSVPSQISSYNLTHNYSGSDACTLSESTWPANPASNEWYRWHNIFNNTDANADITSYIANQKIIVIKTNYTSSQINEWGNPGDMDTPIKKTYWNYQYHMRAIINKMKDNPDNYFVVWTNPPLVASMTNDQQSFISHCFARWMKDTLANGIDPIFGTFPKNVYIFDYFHKTSDANYKLSPDLAVSPSSSEPNSAATVLVSPQFVREIFDNSILYEPKPLEITTLKLAGSAYCPGTQIVVPFTVQKQFNSNNQFCALMSNELGNFSKPDTLGCIDGTTSGIIYGFIKKTTKQGTGYRVRVIGISPMTTGSDNGTDLTIYQKPNPKITGSISACENSSEEYLSNDDPFVSIFWSVIGGSIVGSDSYTDKIQVRWGVAGIGSVALIQRNKATNCPDTAFIQVNINPKPTVSASGPTLAQANSSKTYTTNTPQGVKSLWSVRGGSMIGSSSGSAFVVKWGTGASGTVTLIQQITSSRCQDSSKVIVQITPSPTPTIQGSSSVCEGNSIIYTTTPKQGISNLWTATGGTIISSSIGTSVYVTWGKAGGGILQLLQTLDSNGNKDSVTLNVTINPLPTPVISGNQNVQLNDFSVFREAKPDIKLDYKWFVTGGTILGKTDADSVIIQWKSVGNAAIKLIENYFNTSCKDSVTLNIVITGVGYEYQESNLKIYPNPASEFLFVEFHEPSNSILKLYDIYGRNIRLVALQAGKAKIDCKDLSGGVYFISVFINGNEIRKKVLVSR